jgi:hypothetical protein
MCGIEVNSLLWWPVQKTTFVPAHKLTFSSLGADRLHQNMAEAQNEVSGFSSFGVFALRDYLGYRQLLKSPPGLRSGNNSSLVICR